MARDGKGRIRGQFLFELVLVLSLLVSTGYEVLVEPGMPSMRPWLLPVALGATAAGIVGLVLRAQGRGRWAGAAYLLAAFAPNGLYVLNALVFAVAIVSLAGVSTERSRPNRGTPGTGQHLA